MKCRLLDSDDVENGILDLLLWRGYILEIELSRIIKFLFISKRYSEFRTLLLLCSWPFSSKLKVTVYVLSHHWRITNTVWKFLLCIWINFLSPFNLSVKFKDFNSRWRIPLRSKGLKIEFGRKDLGSSELVPLFPQLYV